MKKIMLVFIFLSVLKINAQTPIDCFKVGDIVYSIFDEKKFNELHDGKWRQVSSASKLDSTDILKYDINNNPYLLKKNIDNLSITTFLGFDATDKFIRGINYNRGEFGNQDDTNNIHAGKSQNSALKDHSHFLNVAVNVPRANDVVFKGVLSTWQGSIDAGDGIESEKAGSNRTLPKYLTLFLYIKVSE